MKKLFSFVLLATFAMGTHDASAQEGVSLGVRAGANFANLTYGDGVAVNQVRHARTSFGGGLFVDFNFSENFALRTGLDYCGLGGKMDTDFYDPVNFPQDMTIQSSLKSTTSLNYLSLPVQAYFGWEIIEDSKLRLNVGAGFFIACLLDGEKEDITTVAGSSPLTSVRDIADDAHRCNFGLTGSLGLSYPLGQRGMLSLEYGLNYGLTKIYKSGDDDSKTYGSRVMLGYSFLLGK